VPEVEGDFTSDTIGDAGVPQSAALSHSDEFPSMVREVDGIDADDNNASQCADLAGAGRPTENTTMSRKRLSHKPLTGRVALVAGATRGAGRGIARALGEAGATVYCTGRSVKGKPSPYGRPETIDETAALIKAAGGTAIALRVDHTNEKEVKALFRRIMRAQKRIDVVVDSVAGEDPLMGQYGFLWQADLQAADTIFRQGLISRIITAKYAARAMMPARRGLIVEVTENDMIGGGGNPMSQAVKMAQKTLPLLWAAELAPHAIAVVAITPGFLRSESMLQRLGVTEDNWREAGKKDPNFLESESPLFVGRAIAALAADPNVQNRTGMLYGSWELGRHYGFADDDGRRPDWGRHKIDFSVLPPTWIDLFRTGADLEIKWLTTLASRTRKFRAKMPS
jgi:NAD(P)-dependent dehydrogenase (short-subunit alcohol dehydrogenase family)